ncbi:hypothetical protein ACFORL_02900 [Legionella dresdenensis]|uniref:Uncharacterized protein n=1 Tax=Legionella dresdenensis TaxID=450200 RepID=A0ABV8CCT2_9GAMM
MPGSNNDIHNSQGGLNNNWAFDLFTVRRDEIADLFEQLPEISIFNLWQYQSQEVPPEILQASNEHYAAWREAARNAMRTFDDSEIEPAIQFFKLVINGGEGGGQFRDNLFEKARNTEIPLFSPKQRLEIVDYLIRKYDVSGQFQAQQAMENKIKPLDDYGIFQSVNEAVAKSVRKPSAVLTPVQETRVKNEMHNALNELKEIIQEDYKKRLQELIEKKFGKDSAYINRSRITRSSQRDNLIRELKEFAARRETTAGQIMDKIESFGQLAQSDHETKSGWRFFAIGPLFHKTSGFKQTANELLAETEISAPRL